VSKSRSVLFDGYKRHVLRDLDTGLIPGGLGNYCRRLRMRAPISIFGSWPVRRAVALGATGQTVRAKRSNSFCDLAAPR
jgi:hypothetical protein